MTAPDRTPVIIAARRTAIGRKGRLHAAREVEHLAAPVLTALLADAGIAAEQVDEAILGNAAGPGGNVARLSLLEAGFPVDIPGMTVDRQCGSGLEAVTTGCRLVASGGAGVVIAGGVESASRAPLRAMPDNPPRFYTRARFSPETLGDPEMIEAAETVARRCGITRADQDAFALRSHRKAAMAAGQGRFAAEIVSLGAQPETDECIRPETSAEKLAALPPVLGPDTTVTAGNACPMNDGAAAVLIVAAHRLAELAPGRAGLAFVDSAVAGVDPAVLGLGPVPATRRLLTRTGLSMADIARVEFNEAFAAQVLACLRELEIDESRVNPCGGALALGHPFGASGAILVTRLFHDLLVQPITDPVMATIGIGGGMGLSTLFRWRAGAD